MDTLLTASSLDLMHTLVGIIGFVTGRLRRRWYGDTLTAIEARDSRSAESPGAEAVGEAGAASEARGAAAAASVAVSGA